MAEHESPSQASSRRWSLHVREQEARAGAAEREIVVRPGALIGRAAEVGAVDVALDDPRVSEFHARLVELNDGMGLEDLNSTNGTRLDGARLAPFRPIQMHDGSEVRIGRSWIEVRAPQMGTTSRMLGRVVADTALDQEPEPEHQAAPVSDEESKLPPEPASVKSPAIPTVSLGTPLYTPSSTQTQIGSPGHDDSPESLQRLREHCVRLVTCHEADDLRGIFDILLPVTHIGRGSSEGNDLNFDYDGVSRAHAELLWDGHQIWIADRDSRHGTWIGEVQLPSSEVQFSKIAPLRPRAMVGSNMVLQLGPLEALLVADLDEAGREPMQGLYEVALDMLVKKHRVTKEQRKRAKEAAVERGVHPGEILISGPEALRPAVWIQVLKLAEVQLLSRRNRA